MDTNQLYQSTGKHGKHIYRHHRNEIVKCAAHFEHAARDLLIEYNGKQCEILQRT